jgi:hypothetical protein
MKKPKNKTVWVGFVDDKVGTWTDRAPYGTGPTLYSCFLTKKEAKERYRDVRKAKLMFGNLQEK